MPVLCPAPHRSTLLASLLWVALCPASQAWSSKSFPLFEPIHQQAIDKILGKQLNDAEREILKQAQTTVDKDQAASQSAEHAMTGIETESADVPAQRKRYIQLSHQWVDGNLREAISLRKAAQMRPALERLGQAIHALQDSTSPSHQCFQVWSTNESSWDKARHVMAERLYPRAAELKARREWLEGAVAWAYDIFMERAPLPAQFFAATGALNLPDTYSSERTPPCTNAT